jgi:phage terminase large subunit
VSIDLSKKQSKAWHLLESKPNVSEVFFGGAAGGGKSWFGCVWHIARRMRYAGSRGVIGRAKLSALEQSTLVTLFEVAHLMGYQVGKDFNYNSQKHVINWANGSTTVLKDLFQYPSDPDFISLGSTEYTDAFIDEVTEITEKAYEIVNTRIRYKLDEYDITPKILSTGNPRKNWVKKKFVDPDELPEHIAFVQSLLVDNPNDKFRELYQQQLGRMSSDYDKERLLHGNWDVDEEVENPFAHNYDRNKHLKLCEFQPMRTIYLSIDFNIDPFALVFAHIWQDVNGFHVHVFDEMTIKSGTLDKAAKQIKEKYGRYLHNFHVTGDYSGSARSIQDPNNSSNWKLLKGMLGISDKQLELKPNPRHANSRTNVNFVLAYAEDFRVSPICVNLDRDFAIVEVDSDEKILKSDRKKEKERADHLDAGRYLLNTRIVTDWIRIKETRL